MTQKKNWEEVKELLQHVMTLEATEREDFLNNAQVNAKIRAEVESLLAFETEAEELMQHTALEFSKDFPGETANPVIGQTFGVYRVVRELGIGGMGAVYLAERSDGKFEQKVALKLLKREMNTAALRRRFQHEREILASLEHPFIARLLDAGTTGDKIPYLAMEYVEGLAIDDYCRKHQLDLPLRLDLFRKVCSAVDFAHRNLIVHRDLKPSNILVTADGNPKLLDFGISKILSADLENSSSATITKLGVMTPSYASPEQIQSKSVTTATDIYSLGVILYELLTFHRPFEAKEGNLKEIYQAVLETDPPLPSSIAETLSKQVKEITEAKTVIKAPENIESDTQNQNIETATKSVIDTNPQTLNYSPQSLRGDLDNIILKALRKEPERRYSSAGNFSEDIKRHLQGLPVSARPNTFSYRAEKFFKRNKVSAMAAGLILLAIIGGMAATLWQARVARAERAKAEKRFNDVRKLANSYLFDVYPEIENLEGSLKARETILTNALEYLDSLSNEAAGDLELQSELATAYEKIGDVQGALNNSSLGNVKAGLESYKKAQKLREAVLAANLENLEAKEKLANNYYVAARTLWNNSQTKDAEESFEKSLKLRRELIAARPDSIEAQNRLAVLLIDYGAIPAFNFQAEKAVVLFDEAFEIIERLLKQNPENWDLKKSLTRGLRSASKAKVALDDYDGALLGLNRAVEVSKELAAKFPEDFRVQRSVWLTDVMICELFISKGDGQKSVGTCERTVEFPKNALAKEPENGVVAYDLAISYFNAARAFRLAENPPRTIEQAGKAMEVMTKLIQKTPDSGEYKRNLAIYQTEMARAQIKLDQNEQAISGLQKVIETLIPVIEADRETTTYQYDLSMAYRLSAEGYFKKGEKAKARENIEKAITVIQKLKELDSLKNSDKDLLTELEQEKAVYSK